MNCNSGGFHAKPVFICTNKNRFPEISFGKWLNDVIASLQHKNTLSFVI